jgi:hypothetical protein
LKWSVRLVHHSRLVRSALALLLLAALPLSASTRNVQFTAPVMATDYMVRIKNHITWSQLPISVYFMRDREYTPAREKAARVGFDSWVQATRGFISYQVQESPDQAQITVTFDPLTNDGHTTTRFNGSRITGGRILVGVRRGWERDLLCIAAHEFGHALGIDGHSGYERDLMYPVHTMGHAWSLTRRDLNTLALAYDVDPETAAAWIPQSR